MANCKSMTVTVSIAGLWKAGWSKSRIARELGIRRETVARHIRVAAEQCAEVAAGDSKPSISPTGSEGSKPSILPTGKLGRHRPRLLVSFSKSRRSGFGSRRLIVRRLGRRLGRKRLRRWRGLFPCRHLSVWSNPDMVKFRVDGSFRDP